MATKKKELLEQEAPVTETVMSEAKLCRPILLNLNPFLLTLAMVWI